MAMVDHSQYFKILQILVNFIWKVKHNAFLMKEKGFSDTGESFSDMEKTSKARRKEFSGAVTSFSDTGKSFSDNGKSFSATMQFRFRVWGTLESPSSRLFTKSFVLQRTNRREGPDLREDSG